MQRNPVSLGLPVSFLLPFWVFLSQTHLWNPWPSSRTTMKVLGSSGEAWSYVLTYSYLLIFFFFFGFFAFQPEWNYAWTMVGGGYILGFGHGYVGFEGLVLPAKNAGGLGRVGFDELLVGAGIEG